MSEQSEVIGNVGQGFAAFIGKLYADKEKADTRMMELLKPILAKQGLDLELDPDARLESAGEDIVTTAWGKKHDCIVHIDIATGDVSLEEV